MDIKSLITQSDDDGEEDRVDESKTWRRKGTFDGAAEHCIDSPRKSSRLATSQMDKQQHQASTGSSSGGESSTPSSGSQYQAGVATRRQAHLASEQKRRESINHGFEGLQRLIPACQNSITKDSKAQILEKGKRISLLVGLL